MLPYPEDKRGYKLIEVESICQLRKIPLKKFWKAFGVNTVMEDEFGNTLFYVCDIERALNILGNEDGVAHLWD